MAGVIELTALATAARAYADGKTSPRDASRLIGLTSLGDVLLHSVDEHAYALSRAGEPTLRPECTLLERFGERCTLVHIAFSPTLTRAALCVDEAPVALFESLTDAPWIPAAFTRERHFFPADCEVRVAEAGQNIQVQALVAGRPVAASAPCALRGSFRPDLGFVQPLGH